MGRCVLSGYVSLTAARTRGHHWSAELRGQVASAGADTTYPVLELWFEQSCYIVTSAWTNVATWYPVPDLWFELSSQ